MPESQLTTIYRIAKGSSLEELQAEVNRILGTKPDRWGLSTGQVLTFYEEGSIVYTREMIGYFPPEDVADKSFEQFEPSMGKKRWIKVKFNDEVGELPYYDSDLDPGLTWEDFKMAREKGYVEKNGRLYIAFRHASGTMYIKSIPLVTQEPSPSSQR